MSKLFLPLVLFFAISFTGCLTAKKMDIYVAEQFNNQLPKPDKRTDTAITITSTIWFDSKRISVTEKKSKSILPLVIYWQYDYRHTCTLNPAIGTTDFRNGIYQQANKLKQKLNGKTLEFNVEQIPASFAIVDRGSILLLVIHWNKLYVEADPKDLIVSYRISQNGLESKSGKIIVNNIARNRGIRFGQSWKSSTREFIAQYHVDIAEMTKRVVNKLLLEL